MAKFLIYSLIVYYSDFVIMNHLSNFLLKESKEKNRKSLITLFLKVNHNELSIYILYLDKYLDIADFTQIDMR